MDLRARVKSRLKTPLTPQTRTRPAAIEREREREREREGGVASRSGDWKVVKKEGQLWKVSNAPELLPSYTRISELRSSVRAREF